LAEKERRKVVNALAGRTYKNPSSEIMSRKNGSRQLQKGSELIERS